MAAPLYARYVPPKAFHRIAEDAESHNEVLQKEQPQLYARYIPPKSALVDTKNGTKLDRYSEHVSKKRKRDSKVEKPLKKNKRDSEKAAIAVDERCAAQNDDESLGVVGGQKNTSLKPLRLEEDSKRHLKTAVYGSAVRSVLTNGAHLAASESEAPRDNSMDMPKRTKKRHEKIQRNSESPSPILDETISIKKHSSVLSKFQKSIQASEGLQDVPQEADLPDSQQPELHDLVPIPPPKQAPAAEGFSALSALPSWLARPVSVPLSSEVSFKELQLDKKIVNHLLQKGFTKALPVQAGVLPLLLPTIRQHPGDLCVSASTGSGKTLAYILPIVESLRNRVMKKIRAMIVVPTRELVNQVRETIEWCCAGTDLQVGTALGTHAFEAEQHALVTEGRRYDPAAYQALLGKMAVEDLYGAGDDVTMSDVDDPPALLPDHVPEYTSNIDILVCTPGRLVDHIKTTKGFTLEHLEWLVIDEADRLLDQSFQEWVETLQKAMTSKISEHDINPLAHDRFLAGLLNIRIHRPLRKVVLSATMTQDLAKLSSLRLTNPKMVIVDGIGSQKEQAMSEPENTAVSGNLHLPSRMQEYVIPVGDGSMKPLYLLKLLLQILDDNQAASLTSEQIVQSQRHHSSSPASSDTTDTDDSGDTLDTDATSSILSDSDNTSSDSSNSLSTKSTSSSSSLTQAHPATPTQSSPFTSTKLSHPSTVLIFTSTNESAHRLQTLLTNLHPAYTSTIATLTNTTSSSSRTRTLRAFATGEIRLIIATDRASRGLDLPHLAHVINYDVPRSVTAYVHRVGRTARAGEGGEAWTLVAGREAAWFWNVVVRGKGEEAGTRFGRAMREVKRVRVDIEALGVDVRERYTVALGALREEVKGKRG